MRGNYGKLFLLLNKRLLKKPSFIILLCMIPVIVFGLHLVSERESGIVRIALVNEGSQEAGTIIDELMNKPSVFLFDTYESGKDAEEALLDNRVDAVWIFPRDYSDRISDFTGSLVKNTKDSEGAVEIVEREDNVLLQLSRMELFGALYSDLSFSLFDNYINIRLADTKVPAGTLRGYYDNNRNTGMLFDYRDTDERSPKEQDVSESYLFTPLRGVLLLLTLLCGLAAAMYYRADLDKEIFTWMPVGNKWVFEHVYLLTALVDGGLVVLITFFITGLATSPLTEIALMFLFILSCCCFCSIIRRLTFNLRSLATFIPILMLAMLVVCPVFIYIRALRGIQHLLPPFYYLMAQNNTGYLNLFVIYSLAIIAVDVLFGLGSRCSG